MVLITHDSPASPTKCLMAVMYSTNPSNPRTSMAASSANRNDPQVTSSGLGKPISLPCVTSRIALMPIRLARARNAPWPKLNVLVVV
ncbi:hypothetical protein G6F58_013822 [Rhizopus delemar]|nr:hypothetical protein G6F58_013822 [Rhizopus delemar]